MNYTVTIQFELDRIEEFSFPTKEMAENFVRMMKDRYDIQKYAIINKVCKGDECG